jgi:hypothetical protein
MNEGYQYQGDPMASMGVYGQGYGAPYSAEVTPELGQHDYEQDQYYNTAENQEEDQFLGFSEGKPREGLYALFEKISLTPKTIRVGNVDKHELGDLGISVREGMRVAMIGTTFGHKMFAQFFFDQANIVTESSMAKRGWFQELFVTSKRSAERMTGTMNPNRPGPTPGEPQSKWSKLFGSKAQAQPQPPA